MMTEITAKSPTPTLGYEDLFGLSGFRPFISENAVSMIHADMETSGGLMETKKIADYAYRYGIKTMFHHAGSPVGRWRASTAPARSATSSAWRTTRWISRGGRIW